MTETLDPRWHGSNERRLAYREFFRSVIPGGQAGHVLEDADLAIRVFRSARVSTQWPQGRYAQDLARRAGRWLMPDDIDDVAECRESLDEIGYWLACEIKTCLDGCDHLQRRLAPTKSELPYPQLMTFNSIFRLDAPNCMGLWLVQMEHEDPLASEWIMINGTPVGVRELILLGLCRPDRTPAWPPRRWFS